jgi:hypothetical protein
MSINLQITDANEKFATNVLLLIIILLAITILIYYYYISNLEKKNCSYMDDLYSELNSNIQSIDDTNKEHTFSFKDYYIKTAYNCCSGGNYKNDFVSTCNLKNILKQGIRGLDFEISSINDKPVVTTSTEDSVYIKETYNYVSMSDVMSIINNYAFASSYSPNYKDPLILHFRINSNNTKMYDNFADILSSYTSILLDKNYSFENNKYNLGDAKLVDLMGKVIIIVDKSNTTFMSSESFMEYVNMTSNSMFMRALRYYDIKYTPDIEELKNYNKKNMTIALPDKGSNPENMSGILVRALGCQLIAMRYQLVDQFLEENNLFFDRKNTAFILKPEPLRYIPVTIAQPNKQRKELSYETRKVASDYYQFDA